jgi:hypothetical protein
MMHDIDNELKLMLEGRFKESRAISDKLEKLGPEKIPDNEGKLGNPDIWLRHCFNRGWFMIQDGDYQKGCQLLESGRFINVYGSGPLKTNAPIYNPTEHDIKGKSIIISLEGGFGDEIIHARFVQSFKSLGAEKVYLAAAPELVSVFQRIPGCDGVILRNESHLVAHDYWVPGFSAGWTSGNTFKDFPNKPYLFAKQESVEIWKEVIKGDKIKVGIRWAGNPKFEHQQFRRFPAKFLTELSKYDEVQLYSLQRDQNIIELPENIVDLQHFLISWEDTLAAIQNLDIVITSCTSIAHAAAALGKETWVLTPLLPYHTWTFGAPHSKKSPYYESVTVYRQEDPKGWNRTFQKLYKDFEKRFELEHIEHPSHDKEPLKLNMGSGFMKLDGYINADCSDICEPDVKVDFNQLPWPWEDDTFQHIVAKDILEHLDSDKVPLTDIIKEMYRVSENGAVWEVQVPHHRSNHMWDDPTHKHTITPGTFNLFNRKSIIEGFKLGRSDSPLAFELDVDMDLCETRYTYVDKWLEMLKNKEITEEQLEFALHTQSNVAEATIMLIQIHKPARYTIEELKSEVKKREDRKKEVTKQLTQ